MKLYLLTLKEWAEYAKKYEDQFRKKCFLLRCETILSVGWKCGGFTYNGNSFTSFSPKDENGHRVMLAVRSDFERWVRKMLIMSEHVQLAEKQKVSQMELL